MAHVYLDWDGHPPAAFAGGAVTVGNFDGVHRGHRELVAAAGRLGSPVVAVTFDPPPAQVLYPGAAVPPPLSTLAERVELLVAAGADHVATLRTGPALLSLSPDAFFEDVIAGQFRATAVAEGYNFRFGRGRTGDVSTMRELCRGAGVAFAEVPPLVVSGEAVSSSRVRAAVAAGDVALAAALLGRPYAVAGVIVSGAKRGRTIGFPTANLAEVMTLVPGNGVYACRADLDGEVRSAAANVGPNPTFGEDARKIEVHLLDFVGDVYGRPLRVEFIARLRETKPFAGVAELTAQLRADVTAARAILTGTRP